MKAADAIASGNLGEWGNEFAWPADKMAKGDWRPAAFYNPDLLNVLLKLENELLVKLGDIAEVEPAGRRVHDAFNRKISNDNEAKPVLWDHKTELRVTMAAQPDTQASPNDGKRDYAIDTIWPKAGRLLIASKIRTNTVRTVGVLLQKPALGGAFVPVRLKTTDDEKNRLYEKALCVWFNSTPFFICLLGSRSKNLSYSAYSLEDLRAMPAPQPEDMLHLAKVYDENQDKILKPWPEMDSCKVKKIIDDAVAPVIGVDTTTIKTWREWVAKEPTVSNKRDKFVNPQDDVSGRSEHA